MWWYYQKTTSSTEEDESFRDINQIFHEKRTFNEILITPDIEKKKITTSKNSLNYKAPKVTKFLAVVGRRQIAGQLDLCEEYKVFGMRLCLMCQRSMKKLMVGLTRDDKDPTLVCPFWS